MLYISWDDQAQLKKNRVMCRGGGHGMPWGFPWRAQGVAMACRGGCHGMPWGLPWRAVGVAMT